MSYLKKKYNTVMAKKIVAVLNLTGVETINFTQYLSSIRTHIMTKGNKDQLRICFNLMDHDSNGVVCPNDIDVYNMQYTGTCSLLSSDFIALSQMFSLKKRDPKNYHIFLEKVPSTISRQSTVAGRKAFTKTTTNPSL